MNIQKNVSLAQYSTMRLGGTARFLCDITNKDELQKALVFAKEQDVNTIMIGSGSNIIWRGDYDGLVVVNRLRHFRKKVVGKNTAQFTIGAGEEWDDVVKRTVDVGYSGIEFLSLIPGTAGATPVQNVGAYGCEIKDTLVSVGVYDTKAQKFVTIQASDCQFGYRTSRFKTTDKGRFFITSITLRLTKTHPSPPFYASLQAYFDAHSITTFTPAVVREAVIAVRTKKLPDPDVVANNGSFFANPVISKSAFAALEIRHPAIAHWPAGDRVKISAAWLIEQAGFKNVHDSETGMATWDKQPLVLINEHARSTDDLLTFKAKIVSAVHSKFGITLEQEPELI